MLVSVFSPSSKLLTFLSKLPNLSYFSSLFISHRHAFFENTMSNASITTAKSSDFEDVQTEGERTALQEGIEMLRKCIRKGDNICYSKPENITILKRIPSKPKEESRLNLQDEGDEKESIKSEESMYKVFSFEQTKKLTDPETQKCIKFWENVMRKNLTPINCTLDAFSEGSGTKKRPKKVKKTEEDEKVTKQKSGDKTNKKKKAMKTRKIKAPKTEPRASLEEEGQLDKEVDSERKKCSLLSEKEDIAKLCGEGSVWAETVKEIQKRKLDQMRLIAKEKCGLCQGLQAETKTRLSLTPSQLEQIKDLNKFKPKYTENPFTKLRPNESPVVNKVNTPTSAPTATEDSHRSPTQAKISESEKKSETKLERLSSKKSIDKTVDKSSTTLKSHQTQAKSAQEIKSTKSAQEFKLVMPTPQDQARDVPKDQSSIKSSTVKTENEPTIINLEETYSEETLSKPPPTPNEENLMFKVKDKDGKCQCGCGLKECFCIENKLLKRKLALVGEKLDEDRRLGEGVVCDNPECICDCECRAMLYHSETASSENMEPQTYRSMVEQYRAIPKKSHEKVEKTCSKHKHGAGVQCGQTEERETGLRVGALFCLICGHYDCTCQLTKAH